MSTSGNNLYYPESGIKNRESIDSVVERLEKYDVISFDVFDTLILRAMQKPTDLFILVGNRLGVMKFYDYRIEAEREARKLAVNSNGEICISDIYYLLSSWCNIKMQTGIYEEIKAEFDVCFANPYMKEIVKRISKKGKQLVAVSNMYLPKEVIRQLLEYCGYSEFGNNIFVSCDYHCNKRTGSLFNEVTRAFGSNHAYIHIGDNFESDFIGARIAGWKSYFYEGVNEIGKLYRPANMTQLSGSIYSGLVNAKLHNGIEKCSPYFEYGYTYGGIIACGYCEWLNKYAKLHDIDCFLFTGRDMYIVHQIYNKFYRKIENHYVAISRFAAQRFSYERFSEYFISSHIAARAHLRTMTIAECLSDLEMDFIKSYLEEYGLAEEDLLTPDNYDVLKRLLREKKSVVVSNFQEERAAAIKYYSQFLYGKKKIAIVDLGWQGTNAQCLKYLIENFIDQNIKVVSLLVCASGGNKFLGHSMSDGTTEAFCCSQNKSPQLLRQFKDSTNIGRFMLELLFTSTEQSLKYFKEDGDQIKKVFVESGYETRANDEIEEIHKGILNYVADYNHLGLQPNENKLFGWDCWLPINKLTYNEAYSKKILSDTDVNPWIGNFSMQSKNVQK